MSDAPNAPSGSAAPADGSRPLASVFSGRGQFKDPISNAAHDWLASMSKALKGLRVYESNNKMLQRFLDKAFEDLKAMHALADDISFSIREDRILYASTIGGVVKIEGVEVAEDRCPASEIITQIARKLASVRQAYEVALEKEQALGGEILISFVILDGRAKNLEILDNPLENADIADRVKECGATWQWPAKNQIVVTAKLVLKPVRREDAVHIDADREEGFPFAFYRNGFRRLSFARGFGMEEMTSFLKAVATDFGSSNNVGEDLVSVLWKLDLPKFRYVTIDGLTIGAAQGTEDHEREVEEIDRLQADIDNLVAQIYAQHTKEVRDEDLVKGASITRDDLFALEDIRGEDDEDLDLLDLVTARAIADIGQRELQPMLEEALATDRELLLIHHIEALVSILYDTESSQDIGRKLELMQQLFDTLLYRSGFKHATVLLGRIRDRSDSTDDLRVVHIARHLFASMATGSRVSQIISALNDTLAGTNPTEVIAFLRMIGAPVAKHIVGALDVVTSPSHRRLLVDLVGDLELPASNALDTVIGSAKWFIIVDLLGLVARLPIQDQAPILRKIATHEHPKVRAMTIGLLRSFPEGGADDIIARAIDDAEAEVRIAACRVAAARLSRKAGHAIGDWLRSDLVAKAEPREMHAMMLAFANIGGPEAVKVLDQLLNPKLFHGNTEVQASAAIALSSIGTPDAKHALSRGLRTLNAKVREACKQGLARTEDHRARESTVTPGFDPFAAGAAMSIDVGADSSGLELGESGALDLAGVPPPALPQRPQLPPPPPEFSIERAPARDLVFDPASNSVDAAPSLPPPEFVPPPRAASPAPSLPSWVVRSRGASDILPAPRAPSVPAVPAFVPKVENTGDLGLDDSPVALDPSALSPVVEPPPPPVLRFDASPLRTEMPAMLFKMPLAPPPPVAQRLESLDLPIEEPVLDDQVVEERSIEEPPLPSPLRQGFEDEHPGFGPAEERIPVHALDKIMPPESLTVRAPMSAVLGFEPLEPSPPPVADPWKAPPPAPVAPIESLPSPSPSPSAEAIAAALQEDPITAVLRESGDLPRMELPPFEPPPPRPARRPSITGGEYGFVKKREGGEKP